MDCLKNVYPTYYDGGLAIIPYMTPEGKKSYDKQRAFVVMTFPYRYYDGEIWDVNQAFYRTTGFNSNANFGLGVTDLDAAGTWIPTNGLVVKRKTETVKVKNSKVPITTCVNESFILKKPFIDDSSTLLSRFHGDLQLAVISYFMGGGIWNLPAKVDQLSRSLVEAKMPDYTKQFGPGCVNLKKKIVKTSYNGLNSYIGSSVSWNWHPADLNIFTNDLKEPIEVDLNDEMWYDYVDSRKYISDTAFKNPGYIVNYLRYAKKKGPEMARKIALATRQNFNTRCVWLEPKEFFG